MKTHILKISTYMLIALASHQIFARTLVFENVNVIPMDYERILYNQRVIVIDDKIVNIEPASVDLSKEVDQIVDASGQYMIPGLYDTHYHQTGKSKEENDLQYKLSIANGVIGILSMAEWPGQDTIAIRKRTTNRNLLSPHYMTVGPQLNDNNVKTKKDAINMVELHKERGYDFIKVHGNITQAAYFTLLIEAEKAGIRVIGHTQRDKPFEVSLRLTSIVHAEDIVMSFSDEANLKVVEIDTSLATKIAAQVKESGIYVAPTLSIVAKIQDFTDDTRFEKLKQRDINKYLSKKVFDSYTAGRNAHYREEFFLSELGLNYMDLVIKGTRKLTPALYKAGVPLLVGSDNFGLQVTGFSLHEEMQHMQNTGIPAYAVLKAATATSARFLNKIASSGTISIGKNADFILLTHNPLIDIKNTQSINGVMLKGEWLNRTKLDEMLLQVERAHKR